MLIGGVFSFWFVVLFVIVVVLFLIGFIFWLFLVIVLYDEMIVVLLDMFVGWEGEVMFGIVVWSYLVCVCVCDIYGFDYYVMVEFDNDD